MNALREKENSKGLTMLEVLVASFILAIVALPLLSLFAYNAKLVQSSYQRTDSTYKAKSIMESLFGYGYTALFQHATSTNTLDASTGKYYTLTLSPSGPAGVVTGTACYFHLIVNSAGTGYFVGPDGKLSSGSLLSITSGLDNLTLDVSSVTGVYKLISGSTTLLTGSRPTGASPVLLIVDNSASTTVKVTVSGSCAVVAYCNPTMDTSKLTAPNASSLLVYNNDAPPTKLLVTAVLKTFKASGDTTAENIYQDTLSVGTLP